MHGTPSRQICPNYLMPIKQAVSKSIPHFPKDVTGVVIDYLSDNEAWACSSLDLDKEGFVLTNEYNKKIRSAWKEVLTSRDYDPLIKRCIFENLMRAEIDWTTLHLQDQPSRFAGISHSPYLLYFNVLLEELGAEKRKVILDKTDFTGVNLTGLRLPQASAIEARFIDMNMIDVSWADADMRSALYRNVQIINTSMEGTDLSGSQYRQVKMISANLDKTNLMKINMVKVEFSYVGATDMVTDHPQLERMKRSIVDVLELDIPAGTDPHLHQIQYGTLQLTLGWLYFNNTIMLHGQINTSGSTTERSALRYDAPVQAELGEY